MAVYDSEATKAPSGEELLARLGAAQSLCERLDLLAITLKDRPAQIYVGTGDPDSTPQVLSFEQFISQTASRARALRSLGIEDGDVVAVMLPVGPVSYPMLFACYISSTTLCVNYFLEAPALVQLIRSSGAKALLTATAYDDDPWCLEKIAHIRSALPGLKHLVFGEGADTGASNSVETYITKDSSGGWPRRGDPKTRLVAIFCTGGTTALPKLAPHSEAMHVAHIDPTGSAQDVSVGDVLLGGAPLFHSSGAVQGGIACFFRGATVLLPSSKGFRDPKLIANYWRFVERYKVTVGAGVPTVVAALAAAPVNGDTSSMRTFFVGGAPLSVSTVESFKRITDGVPIVEGWGMTEACGFATMNPLDRQKIGSAGVPLSDVELQIRVSPTKSDDLATCDVNEIGEIVIRGKSVISGYFGNTVQASDAFTPDGWLRTGDLGRLDEDGFLWVTGRAKDLIIRGGHNIDPMPIEEAAYQHPSIQLAAAVGRPDKYSGEIPILFVVLKEGTDVSENELIAFMAERIHERAGIPREVIKLNEFPMSGPGKILKRVLRNEAVRIQFEKDLLGALALLNETATVTVVADERVGTIAEIGIRPNAANRPKVKAAIAEALAGYTVKYRVLEPN